MRKTILLLMLMGFFFSAFSQTQLRGKVVDKNTKEALPGVSVVVKGTTNGTITDVNGAYTIANVPEKAILQFTFVGMKSQEFAVGGKSTIDVTLEEDAIGIEEVVAIGYGTMKKSDLTGSVARATIDDKAGVRMGESAARDQRIALSCSKDSGECGQGWFQTSTDTAIADTLAPLLHWRLCHVYDWLYLDTRHGYDVAGIAAVYGDSDVRTGCVGCNLTDKDTALERLIRNPAWEHLRPLMELKPLYRELTLPTWRKRKAFPETNKDGSYSKNGQRMGPLTMKARRYGLKTILDIQKRAGVDLINAEEESRIIELWTLNTWPNKWSENDIDADKLIDIIKSENGHLIYQSLLIP